MDGWNGQTEEWTDGWMDGSTDEQDGQTEDIIDDSVMQMDELVDRGMDERLLMDGRQKKEVAVGNRLYY